MKKSTIPSLIAVAVTATLLGTAAHAQIIITEVDPTGSSASYAADWFELKNIGSTTTNIAGWKMDDNSASFSLAVPLRGITSIAPGQSVVFLEGTTSGSTDSTLDANFTNAWFGSTPPMGLTVANYGGSGVSLGAGGDAVNIYDSTGTLEAAVSFGASTSGFTFDNSAGASGAISQLSVAGVNGAFVSFNGAETGSPGNVAPVPEPSMFALGGLGLTAIGFLRRNRKG